MAPKYKSIPLSQRLRIIPVLFGARMEASYSLLRRDGTKEVRRYDALVVAQTSVPGDHESAAREGMRRLTEYLLGRNLGEQRMSFTTPVLEERSGVGWTVSFILPAHCTLASAPRPQNRDVRLHGIPPQTVATLRYTGKNSEEKMDAQCTKLFAWLGSKGEFRPVAPVRWALYDGPFALPFIRRYEAQVEVASLQ